MTRKKRFGSVSEMVRAVADDVSIADDLDTAVAERALIKQLIILRLQCDLSQKDIAEKLGRTQSWVSKLEQGTDNDLKIGELDAYLSCLGLELGVVFAPGDAVPKEFEPTNQIKHHVFQMKHLMDRLASLAKGDDGIAEGVGRFIFLEVPLNVLRAVADSARLLPEKVLEQMQMMVLEQPTRQACSDAEREPDKPKAARTKKAQTEIAGS